MRKLVGAFVLCALLIPLAVSAERSVPGRMKFEHLSWRNYLASGNRDSAMVQINGAVQTSDTTQTFESAKIAPWVGLETGGQASNAVRLWVYTSSGGVSNDTLFVLWQGSYDGTNWTPTSTASNMLGVANAVASIPIAYDSDAAVGTPAFATGNLFNWPLWRFIVRADGNTGALMPNARFMIAYSPSEPDPEVTDANVAGKWQIVPLKWRQWLATGYVDSLSNSVVGAGTSTVVDTSSAFSLANAVMLSQVATATAQEHFKLYVQYAGTDLTDMDTTHVAQEISPDGYNWISNATLTAVPDWAGSGATESFFPYLSVVTNVANTSAWGAPWVRWRIRSDSGATIVSTSKLFVGFQPYKGSTP
jgi:hypothetical protein